LAVDLAKRGVKKTEIEAVKEWEEPEVTFGSCSSHCGFIWNQTDSIEIFSK